MKALKTFAILIAVAGICHAATIQVPVDQPTIQAGIDAAVDGDTVLVAPGSYYGMFSIVSKSIALISEAGANETFLSAADSVVRIAETSGSVVVEGFRIGDASHGILVRNVTAAFIKECTLDSLSVKTVFTASSAIDLRECTVWFDTDTNAAPIEISDSSTADIDHNLFAYGTRNAAILINEGSQASIKNNTFYTCGGGVANENGGTSKIRNNIFSDLPHYGIYSDGTSTPLIDYNLFYLNSSDILYASAGVGNINDDPQFVEPGSQDFGLVETSPCIDSGDPDPTYNDPDGTRNDIGAFPFFQLPDLEFLLLEPIQDSILISPPNFVWSRLADTTVLGTFSYTLLWDDQSDFASADSAFVGTDTMFAPIHDYAPLTQWHWKVRADSESGFAIFSSNIGSFYFDDIPTLPMILLPESSVEAGSSTWLIWTESQDLDPGDSLWYQIQMDDAANFSSVDLNETILTDSLGIPPPSSRTDITGIQLGELSGYEALLDDTYYYWRLRAFDKYGGTSPFTTIDYWFFLNKENTPPTEVTDILSPLPDQPVNDLTPTLTWQHASDPDLSDTSDKLRYRVQVDVDQAFDSGSFQENWTPFGQHTITTDSLADEILHYWRIMTEDDDGAQSAWSATQSFWTNYRNDFPTTFSLLQPEDDKKSVSLTPELHWQTASDHDPLDSVGYTLVLALDPGFLFKTEFTGLPDTSYAFATELSLSENYWWKVKAVDNYSGETWSTEVFTFRTLVPGDADGNGSVSIGDAVYIINYIFGGGQAPDPPELGDADCNGSISIGDAVYIINFIFGGGPEPCVP